MQWTPDLSVGVEDIDVQHRELFRRITELVEAVKKKQCKFLIGGVMAFLHEYVVEHFGAEEALMVKYDYPDYKAHRAQHVSFIARLGGMEEELKNETSSYTRSVYVNQMVVDWILEHIKNVDTRLGAFLKARTPAG
ncbi:MAG: bacteriohemerythrin [Nitrospirota bacterium]|jgi:hemerythrin-like metal-binding protein